jgi:CRP-like cAMP-binding protein
VASAALSGFSLLHEESAVLATERARENRILALLSPPDLEALLPHLEERRVPLREMLHPRAQPLECAYFPLTCIASMTSAGAEGEIIEVATVGNEGVVGVLALLGGHSVNLEVLMQVAGDALQMRAVMFLDLAERLRGFSRVLQRYTAALVTQIAQGSACNRVHPVEGRCARWLLQTHDRVHGDEFVLTQEFLAQMIGVRRASVSEVAAKLQQKRLIHYSRGTIQIVDRAGLERVACECYAIVAGEYERLLGASSKSPSA